MISFYDTKILSYYNVTELRRALTRANITQPFPAFRTVLGHAVKDTVVVTPTDDYADIPSFTQPVDIDVKGQTVWVVDGRPFMRQERTSAGFKVTAENDWTYQGVRIALHQVFMAQNESQVMRLDVLPAKVFTNWITLSLAKRLNLDLESQIRVSVIAAYYYHQMFLGEMELTNLQSLVGRIRQVTHAPADRILSVVDDVGSLHTIELFIQALMEHGGSLRLNNIGYKDLYLILSSSWGGVHARENVGLAMEHPASFIAMVYSAIMDRSRGKTQLGRLTESAGRANDHNSFRQYIHRLVSSRFV